MTDGVKGSNFTLGLISRIATVCPGIYIMDTYFRSILT